MRNSNRKPPTKKELVAANKLRDDFPLGIHKGTGYWCKKIRGVVHYFGKYEDDPKGIAAEDEWNRVKDDLLAGREVRENDPEIVTVADLSNAFLSWKEEKRDNKELSPRTFRTYYDTCERVVKIFGKNRSINDLRPEDFGKLRKKLAENRGLVSLRNEIQRVRSLFLFGFDEGHLLTPVRYGRRFERPKKETVDLERQNHKAEHGDRMFEAHELRSILDEAKQPLKSMILLAANSGFGQSDLSALPTRAVNLETGWCDFARVKNATPRKIPLWPETIASIEEWLPMRPRAAKKEDERILFLTVRGSRWVKTSENGAPKDAIAQEFNKILTKLNLKRSRVGFYALRHGFETIAGETLDQVAVDSIMGHKPQTISSHYRERISDDRLRNVVEHVRKWLFEEPTEDSEKKNYEISDPSDPCDPPESINGSQGTHGSQNTEKVFETNLSALKLFVG